MTTILKNTTISGTGYLSLAGGSTSQRPTITTTVVKWTNTGSQSYSVLSGPVPTLSNTTWTAPTGVTSIEVLVVAGGGSGGSQHGGGGGAGGLIYRSNYTVTPGSSYTVTVGAGGTVGAFSSIGNNGSNSVFDSLTAIGGGAGGGWGAGVSNRSGATGGSGGGASLLGNSGAGTSGQGFAGGNNTAGQNGGETSYLGWPNGGAGGGGAGGIGTSINYGMYSSGGGGPGLPFNITGTTVWYAGGGSGGSHSPRLPAGPSLGGGGAGGLGNNASPTGDGAPGTAGTGGGGGGSGSSTAYGGAGGSGVVIIRYSIIDTANVDPTGAIRYNSDLRDIEVWESNNTRWISQNPVRNFAGHNLIKYSDQLETAPPNTASNGQTFHWTQFGSSIQTTAITPPVIINTPVTLNPLDTNGGTVSTSGLTFTDDGSNGWNNCRANIGVSSGKWYWEYQSIADGGVMCASVAGKNFVPGTLPGQSSNFGVTFYSNGTLYKETSGGGTSGWGSSYGVTDVIGIALDMDAGKVYFSKNGIWQNSANPTAGTGAASTTLLTYDSVYYPIVSTYYSGSVASLNFGANTFRYGPPVGFLPYAQARSVTKLNSPATGTSYGLINANWNSPVAFTAGKTYTFSIFAKAAEWTRLGVRIYDGSNYFIRATINLSVGAQVTDPGNVAGTTTVVSYGNGWYRVMITGVATATSTAAPCIECHNTSTVQNTETCNGSGIYIYAAQFEEGIGASPYTLTKDQASPIPANLNGYRTHTFTSTGTSGFTPSATGTVEVLVVAGGGAGNQGFINAADLAGGGGGAGGLIYRTNHPVIAEQTYVVTVGGGGAYVASLQTTAAKGDDSVFGSLTAIGGGGAGQQSRYGGSGGSGGGGGGNSITGGAPVQGQGNQGGQGAPYTSSGAGAGSAGGGGGAGGPGGTPNAGPGLPIAISGTMVTYATGGAGAVGGGSTATGAAGAANTGNGGGGGNGTNAGAAGGSGIVIVRYRYD
jgi:hypothetical protein